MSTATIIDEDDRTFWDDLAGQAAEAACGRLGHVWVEVTDLDWDERTGSDLFQCKRCCIDMCEVFGHSWVPDGGLKENHRDQTYVCERCDSKTDFYCETIKRHLTQTRVAPCEFPGHENGCTTNTNHCMWCGKLMQQSAEDISSPLSTNDG